MDTKTYIMTSEGWATSESGTYTRTADVPKEVTKSYKEQKGQCRVFYFDGTDAFPLYEAKDIIGKAESHVTMREVHDTQYNGDEVFIIGALCGIAGLWLGLAMGAVSAEREVVVIRDAA